MALKTDRVERALKVGDKLMARLKDGRVKEAWGTIWAWHKTVDLKAAKPCFRGLEHQTKEREALYGYVQPPGEKMPKNADRALLDDKIPSDQELRQVTKRGMNNKNGGAVSMRVEDLKGWLAGAEREEKAEKEGGEGHEGRGGMWWLLVKLVQHIWNTGEIPR